ncbi:MAG TPA: DUF4249 family protein [Chitinophagaceae bacterium]|nr:DUF4249 family protein [Chitinophagaceae bacterium]
MKNILNSFYTLLAIILFSSCEKVVTLDVKDGQPLPYVDAWINDQPGVQTIKFLQAVNYTSASEPAPIAYASIILTDITSNKQYPFTYANGAYRYDAGAASIGFVGHVYQLNIVYKGIPFVAVDTLKRNTVIDSITSQFKKKDSNHDEGYYATFYAKDLAGATDYYWIRTQKNGAINFYAGEMFSIDGSFNENISDGFEFIPPFREGITADDHPYEKGDKVKVLIRSLSKPTYDFGNQMNNQLINGGLFATILANVPTNLSNQQAGSTLKIYGWFGTVSDTWKEKTME